MGPQKAVGDLSSVPGSEKEGGGDLDSSRMEYGG